MNPLSCPARRRATRVTALALALLAGRLPAQETPPGPVVELPKFVVTDSRELPPPESWRYGEIPGFEILSSTTDRKAKQLIRDFLLFKQALGLVFPVPNGASGPTALILVGKGGQFEKFEPTGKTTIEGVRASLYLHNREQTAIVIDFSSSTLNLVGADTTDDAATGSDSGRIDIDHHKQLYREYVHYLLGGSEPRPPAWLEEGMAQIIMAMKFDKENIYFGQIEDPNEVSTRAYQIATVNAMLGTDDATNPVAGAPVEDRDFNVVLRNRALVPLQEFFTTAHDSAAAVNPLGNNRWAKQAYAFVHMCLYGQNGRFQKPFAQFLARISREPVSEAVFQDCFKMTYKGMLDELRGYVNFTNYKSQEFHAKKGQGFGEPPALTLRDATQAEVGRIKGDAFGLGGHVDTARTELRAAYIRGERDPRLLAALGTFQHANGEDDHARKFLEAAVKEKVVRPGAYLALAQLRYADALAKPAGGDGVFSTAQVSGVLELLRTARTQPPPLPAGYELMADTWARSADKPKREDIGMLIEGVKLFPTRLRLLHATAAFCVEAGLNELASPLIDYGLKMAPDAKAKGAFEKLKAALPAAAGQAPAK